MIVHVQPDPLIKPLFVILLALGIGVWVGCGETTDADTPAELETVEVEAEGAARPSFVDLSGIDDPVDRGALLYRLHCRSCHGETGVGDGDIAPFLNLPVRDLTMLQVNNDGVFPEDRVYAYVDGTDEVSEDGSREMPVWGGIWEEQLGSGSEQEVRERIGYLVAYVRSIQAEPDTAEAED